MNNNAPDEDYLAARRDLSTASATLAVEFADEAVLNFQSDRALMRRRGEILYLYDWWLEWANPQVIDKIPQPFEIVHGGGLSAS